MIKSNFFLVFCFVFSLATQAKDGLRVRVLLSQEKINSLKISGQEVHIQEDSVFKRVSIPDIVSQVTFENYRKERDSFLWFYQDGHKVKKKKSPLLSIQGKDLELNGRAIPDDIFLWPVNSTLVDVVAVLDLEEYLRGVVPSEMPIDWPMEALKSQAVLARAYTLHQMQKNSKRHFHLQSSVLDQKYSSKIILNRRNQEKLNQAIQETKDLVLTDRNGDLVKPLYHADCGGTTVPASQVWGGRENIDMVGVRDPMCLGSHQNVWSYHISKKDLVQKLLLKGTLISIEVPFVVNLRPEKIIFKTTKEVQSLSPQILRSALGFMNVRSAIFKLEIMNDQVRFSGAGFGHGVGMCQNGAKNLALKHKNYKEILNYYFPRYRLSVL